MAPKPSVRGEYIETETGNKISRRASILGPKHIILAGKCVIQADVVIHGDLVRPTSSTTHNRTASTATTATDKPSTTDPPKGSSSTAAPENQTSVHLGRHVYLSSGVVLHPPSRVQQGNAPDGSTRQVTVYFPMRIESHVFIGPGSVIRAAEVRSHVHIGANVVVGNMCLIKEGVKVLDGAVLPAGTVWASGVVVGGRPARVVGVVGEGWGWGGEGAVGASGKGGHGAGGEVEASVGAKVRERWALVGNRKV